MRVHRMVVVAAGEEQAAIEIIEAQQMRVMIFDAAGRQHPDVEAVRAHGHPQPVFERPKLAP
jgi:hypothetical protein